MLAGSLLLGEFIWLASRFTTSTLPESDESWVRLMRAAHYLPQIGLAVLTMLLLFRKADAVAQRPIESLLVRSRPRRVALLLAQVGAFGLFAYSTAGIFEENLAGVERPLLAIGIWAALALAVTSLGMLLFLPLPALLRGLRERAGLLLGACILGLIAWWAGQYAANDLGLLLQVPTLRLSDWLLGLVESNYLVDVATFDIRTYAPAPGFWVHIAPQCSGFEGIGLMSVFSASYVWLFRSRLRFPQLLLLPVLGIVGIWLLNVLRIVALVLVGTHVSAEVAVSGFHSLAGTFAFCLAALLLVAASTRSAYFSAPGAGGPEHAAHERDATAAYLVPFLITVAVGMIVTGLGESGKVLQPLKLIAPAVAFWLYRRSYSLTIPKNWAIPLVLGAVAFVTWIWIPRADVQTGAEPPSASPGGAASSIAGSLWLLTRILSSVCIAPLVEELAFRGYLVRRLTSSEFESVTARQISVLAWTMSSLLFGVLHGHWLAATLAGALYGYAYMRRGQLFDCILAHACTNLMLVVLAFATGDWSLL